MPFHNHWQRFQFRATAAYYLCWYTIKKNPLFSKFGKECKSHVVPMNRLYESQSKDENLFDCSLLSFCPDVCFGNAILNESSQSDYKKSHFNPCYGIQDGTCEISTYENQNLDIFKTNFINITCNCEKGFKFFTKLGICVDIDECIEMRHDCVNQHETCINTVGSYECLCKRGYRMKYFEPENNEFQIFGKHLCVLNNYATRLEHIINSNNHKYDYER